MEPNSTGRAMERNSINVEQYIVDQVKQAVSRVEDDLTESLIDFLDAHLDEQVESLITSKVIEKCLNINDNVSAVLNSRDDEDVVRKFCQEFMKRPKE